MSYNLEVNGASYSVDAEGDTPLLWVLRDILDLTGTKFGCGIGQCGACTVHANGAAVRSCQLPLEAVAGLKITTIEAIGDTDVGQRVQERWLA
jgi:isoquinoline 1-oxidoreductase subunit alpha